MSLASILNAASENQWLDDVTRAMAEHDVELARDESRKLSAAIVQAYESEEVTYFCNLLVAALHTDTRRTLERLRRSGMLRPSKVGYGSEFLAAALKVMCDERILMRLGSEARSYLESVNNLNAIGANIGAIERQLVTVLQLGGTPFLKRVFATIELVFMGDIRFEFDRGDATRNTSDINFWTRESLAEAFSYLAQLFNSRISPLDFDCPVDGSQGVDAAVSKVLVLACHVCEFREWETLIDGLGFVVRSTGPNRYVVEHPNHEVERSIRLGLIFAAQGMARAKKAKRPQVASLRKFAEHLDKTIGDRIFQRVDGPFERYRYEFPSVLFNDPKMLAADELFAEEIEAIQLHATEWQLEPITILDFEVATGVRIRDLIKVQRIFYLMSWCYGRRLLNLTSRGVRDSATKTLMHQSVIMLTPDAQLQQLVAPAVGMEKSVAVANYLTWNTANYLDIQYTPFLPHDGRVSIPAAVLSHSNLIRNALQASRGAARIQPSDERFARKLAEEFKQHTDDVRSGVEYQFEGQVGELDVIAVIENVTVVLEVKNSLLPTDAHEMRTSWDHIQKASSQLTKLSELCSNALFQEYLENRTGLRIRGTSLRTGIVVSNRMFHGLRNGGHPVRSYEDFQQFLKDGSIHLGKETKRLWIDSHFQGADLISYLSDDVTLTPLWNAMEPHVWTYQIGEFRIEVPSAHLNMLTLAKELGFEATAQEMEAAIFKANVPSEPRNEKRERDRVREILRKKKKAERERRKRNR